jgi:hypothetical protein
MNEVFVHLVHSVTMSRDISQEYKNIALQWKVDNMCILLQRESYKCIIMSILGHVFTEE